MNIFKRIFIVLGLLYTSNIDAQTILDLYINEAIENNLVIKEKSIDLETSLHALKAAKAMNSLTIDFMPAYTLAAGGRTIDLPLGTLLNPAYSTLNQLTASSNLPQLEDESILLNPNNFYDIKTRISYPIYNQKISRNIQLNELRNDLAAFEVELYKDQLVNDISNAFFDLKKAQAAVSIYSKTKILIKESLRISQSLFKNGLSNRTEILKNETELIAIETEIDNSKLQLLSAQAYLNFLLNRPLDSEIETDGFESQPSLDLIMEATSKDRIEIKQLETVSKISKVSVDLAQSAKRPTIQAFVDIGIQDFDFTVSDQSLYVLGGISMDLNLYDGGKRKEKIKQRMSELQASEVRVSHLKNQLDLEVTTIKNKLNQALNTYSSKQSQVDLNKRIYDESFTLYKQSKINNIALLDARNTLTTSQLMASLALYDSWTIYHDLKRITNQK